MEFIKDLWRFMKERKKFWLAPIIFILLSWLDFFWLLEVVAQLRLLFIPYFNMTNYKSNPLKTILTICIGFLIIFLIQNSIVFLYLALILGLIGLTSNFLSEKIERIWFKIGQLLGYIIPNLVLSIIFYFLLFPISLISKFFKKEDLLKLNQNYDSTFIKVNKEFDADSFKRPFWFNKNYNFELELVYLLHFSKTSLK